MAEGEKNMKVGIHPETMDCTVTLKQNQQNQK